MVRIPNPLPHAPRANKYGNKVVYLAGRRFASKKEGERFLFLQDAQRRGLIRELRCQVRFPLPPCTTTYVADFVYILPNGDEVVEDVKGSKATRTDVFKIKKDMMYNLAGRTIREVYSATEPVGA